MNRREFLKISCSGLITLYLSGCGLNMQSGQNITSAAETVSGKENSKMKITVITGSPHKAGTSALLADKFIAGAEKNGHKVFRFNAAFKNIHACTGCNACGMNGPCVFKDDIERELMPELLDSDMIVLVTPLYYYDMSAQLKTVIDRFYSRTYDINGKQSVLLAAGGSNTPLTMRSITKHYETLAGYMHWQDRGMVLAPGCPTREAIAKTEYPQKAFELGMSL